MQKNYVQNAMINKGSDILTIKEFEVKGKIDDLINILQKVKNEYGNLEINTVRNDELDFREEDDVSFEVNKNKYNNEMYVSFY